MTDTTYNGWANYETWAVGMFLDGNYTGPFDYYETIERVGQGLWSGGENHKRSHVADALKDWVEENVSPHSIDDDHPDPQLHPLTQDLLGAALSSVDWYELADAWIQNLSEQTV